MRIKKTLIYLCALTLTAYNVSASAGRDLAGNHEIEKNVKSAHSFNLKRRERKLDRKLKRIIRRHSLTGDPLKNRTDPVPDISSPVAQLGMELFFSKMLGGDGDSACVTCHHPMLGGGDNLSLPIGVGADDPDFLGLGRTNDEAENNEPGPPVPRNAPTTFNTIAWDQVMFHDGRLESLDKTPGMNGVGLLGISTPDSDSFGVADPNAGVNLIQAQARFPVTSPEEMKGFKHDDYTNQTIRDLLAGRLGGYGDEKDMLDDPDYWLGKFSHAFVTPEGASDDEIITEQKVSFAIGEYERSQVFIDTPWKRYIEGDKQAISVSAKKGALLFFRPSRRGGAGCSSCHSGDFFTDEGFHNLAMPQIGPGKGDGSDGSKDFGRARETGLESDMFAFRTPSLINVEVTGPWSHAGAYTSLEAVIKHHLNAAKAIRRYDFDQLDQDEISNQDLMIVNTKEALNAPSFGLQRKRLNNRKVGHLVEFLKSLTDPCTKDSECLSKWIPDSDPFYFDDPDWID